ncbi:hypothetical protein QBC34DRAFT_463743 [Podospora aff. communis PSN243]|uniref:Uncharacterized protein n=1 Tax=Podospora aff. communis PSN243 TaxID=3040156 RepID=A0AAV9GNX3_9PEZI|nr:hypothetical protein QBC34DRAFT_463743 [Podospora aff. communis PSN243]
MTNLRRLLLGSCWVLAAFVGTASAGFTNAFEGVKAGQALELSWEKVEERYLPVCITAQLIHKGKDGTSATVYKANVTSGLTGTSFTWQGVPFPLNHVPEGMYQLEIHPAGMTGSGGPLLAKSPFFEIGNMSVGAGDEKKDKPPSSGDNKGGGSSSVNKPLAIGLGVAIGVPSVIALVVVGWCFRRRRRMALLEKRRRTRRDFVIN